MNKAKQNYITTNRKALAMIMLYISSNIFCWETNLFLCKPHGSGVLGQQTTNARKDNQMVVIILGYEFIVVYKLGITHVVVDVLSKLPNSSEPLGVLD